MPDETRGKELEEAIEREAKRVEEDCTHSSKAHYNAAVGWSRCHYLIGIPSVLLAAGASWSGFGGKALIAGVLSVVVAAIAAVNTFLNPADREAVHKAAGGEYGAVRNRARRLREIQLLTLDPPAALQERIESLAEKRDSLNMSCPRIPRWAYLWAKRGIEAGEADHQADLD